MAYFIRMIAASKWLKCKEAKIADIMDAYADTITSELRTTSNTLSLWKTDSLDEEDLKKIYLALSLGRDKATRLELVIIDENLLDEYGLEYSCSPEATNTPYTSAKQQHFDLIGLNYKTLGNFGDCILQSLENQEISLKKINKPELVNLWVESYKNKEFDLDRISPNIRNEIVKDESA